MSSYEVLCIRIVIFLLFNGTVPSLLSSLLSFLQQNKVTCYHYRTSCFLLEHRFTYYIETCLAFPNCYCFCMFSMKVRLQCFDTVGSMRLGEGHMSDKDQCHFSLEVLFQVLCLQCFDAVGWAAGRASGL